MENHWQKLWNNRKVNFEELNTQDEARLILELKRIVGWDFKNAAIAADEFRKEYEYIRRNLGLSDKLRGGVFLKSVAAAVPISIFSGKTASRLAARITRRICLTLPKKLSAWKI